MGRVIRVDPDVALQTRLSFGRRTPIVVFVIVAGLALALFVSGAPGRVQLALAAGVGLGALLLAFPFAAIHIVSLERDHRLDQHRLTGRSDGGLAVALIAGASWILLSVGLAAFLFGERIGLSLTQVLALALAGAAAGSVILSSSWSTRADSGVLAGFALALAMLATAVVALRPGMALPFIGASAAVCMICAPFVLRAIRRPATPRRMPKPARLRGLVTFDRVGHAEFGRTTIAIGGWLLPAFALVVPGLMVLVQTRGFAAPDRDELGFALMHAPLAIAAVIASTMLRKERASGGLDRIALSGQGRWRVVLDIAGAIVLPFAMIAALALVPILIWQPRDAVALVYWPLSGLFLMGAGMAEGIRSRTTGLYIGPAVVAWVFATSINHGPAAWVIGLAAWIPLVMAVECLERPDSPPIPPAIQPMAAAALGAAVTAVLFNSDRFFFQQPIAMVAGWMALLSGVLQSDRASPTVVRRTIVSAIACGAAAALTEYYAIGPAMRRFTEGRVPGPWLNEPVPYCALAGALAASAYLWGSFAQQSWSRHGPLALLARMIPLALAYAFGSGMTTYTFITRRGPGPGYFEMKAWSEAGFAAALLLMAMYLARAPRQRS